jgi:hypothetical protein
MTKAILILALIAVGAGIGVLERHVEVWQSEQALWTATAAHNPRDIRALVNLGVDAIHRGDLAQAESLFVLADHAPLGPDGAVAADYVHSNWVSLRLYQGRYAEARRLVRMSNTWSLSRRFCPQYPTLHLCED